MAWLVAAASVALLVGCHTITEEVVESPTEPEPVANVGAILIPVVLPASNPTPEPVPEPAPEPDPSEPAPDPTPTPEPTPAPGGGGGGGGGGCGLPSQSPDHKCSRQDYGVFYTDVEEAITRAIEANPKLFNMNDLNCPTCPRIKKHQDYVDAVAAEMEGMGYCAFYDGEELAVKNTNDFSEQYDISTSNGYVRRGEKIYRATCWPAWF
jgi:hypothetical protein